MPLSIPTAAVPTMQTQVMNPNTQAGVSDSGSGLTTSNLVGDLSSLFGAGLGAYNQQQNYNVLSGALKTIGPTQLNPWGINGPGGMSSGYNPTTGTGSINLGSLTPGYGALTGAGTGGAFGYNAGLNPMLTGMASSTLAPSLGTLTGAYGNYGLGMNAANTQLGALGQTYNTVYGNTLNSLIGQQTPALNQEAFGLQNTLFGKGVLDSTGGTSGAIATGNFGSQVNAQLATDRLTAQQQALAAQAAGVQNYGSLSNSAGSILQNALNNFGNTNQLVSGLNTAGLTNSLSAFQGAGALNTLGLNNYNASLQTGMSQAQARNMSLFPYASVATALSGTQNGTSAGANFLSQLGSSLSGNSGGLTGLLKQYLNGGNSSGLGGFGDLGTGVTGFDPAITGDLSSSLSSETTSNIAGTSMDAAASGTFPSEAALNGALAPYGVSMAPAATGTSAAADAAANGLTLDSSGMLAPAATDVAATDAAAGGGSAGDAAATGSLGGAAGALAIGLSPLLMAASIGGGEGSNYWSSLGNSLNIPIDPNAQSGTGMAAGRTGLSIGQMNALNEVGSALISPNPKGAIDPGFNQQVPAQILQQIQNNPAAAAYLQQVMLAQQYAGGPGNFAGGSTGGLGIPLESY